LKAVKFIHIFDDEKFVNHAIKIFETLKHKKSEYYVIRDKEDLTYNHVTSPFVKQLALNSESDFKLITNSINNNECKKVVLIHALSLRKQKLIKGLNSDVLLVWFIWGYDLYNSWKPLKYKIYNKQTFQFVFKSFSLKSKIINRVFFKYNFYLILKNKSKIYNGLYYNMVNKIDLSAPVLPTEMKYLNTINKKLKYVPFTYGNLELFLGNLLSKKVTNEKNILVGNSSTPTNNHVEVFLKLSKLDLGNRKIIVPLSYGDKGSYLDFVMRQGEKLLGKNFYPILDYMPLEKYNKIILSCGIAIFNHIRQQAVGNIIVMTYFGARVFFNKDGVAYDYYKSEGLNINTLDELNSLNLNTALSNKDKKMNIEKMEALYSQQAVENKVKKLYKIILNHPKISV